MTASAWSGTRTRIVSKNASCTSSRPAVAQPAGKDRGQPVDALRDQLESLAAVVHGVHRGHHRQQHLRRADVGGRLLAPDVLLARLQRKPQRGVAVGVDREADEATGQRALEPCADAHVGGVRPAEPDRDPEALRGADDDVGAHLAGRREQHEREQVGRDARERARGVHLLDQRGEVAHEARGRRVLRQGAEAAARGQALGEIGDDDLDADRLGARPQDRRASAGTRRRRRGSGWTPPSRSGGQPSSPRPRRSPRRAGRRWRSAAL